MRILVLAAGGGGSGGFSGGGGGGGFSGGGGGGGASGGGESFSWQVYVIVAVVAFFAFVVVPGVTAMRLKRKRERDRQSRDTRAERTRAAAAEAVEDDPHFAPDAVESAATALFVELQAAWDARDVHRLRPLAGPDLLVEWERRLADFRRKGWHNRVTVHEPPAVRYVGLENREDDAQDRVVVALECRIDDYVEDQSGGEVLREGQAGRTVRLCEYWTLAWTPAGWSIDSIQGEEEGRHHLDAPLVASPWADEVRLHDAAVVEGAVADAAPAGSPAPAELVDVDYASDARAAALDLSLVDGRFAPAVLEAAVRRAVAAWVTAVDGADDELLRVATPDGARSLLFPDPTDTRARLVVRGARVGEVRIAGFDPDATPARMDVEVTLAGRRYVEDRDTASVLSGDRDRETSTIEHLVFALDETVEDVPWRLVVRG